MKMEKDTILNTSTTLKDLEKVASFIPAPIYWVNSNSVVLGVNQEGCKKIGVASSDYLIGKTPYDLYSFEMADHIVQHNNEVMRTEKILSQEEQVKNMEGELKYYTAVKAPLYDEDSKVIGLIGTSIDITDRKQAEEALKLEKEKSEVANEELKNLKQKAESRAEVAMEAKAEFLRNMSHDLRTPFTGIISLGQLLEHSEINSERKEKLHAIVESSSALLSQLNEILNFLESTEFHKPVVDVPFDIRAMASTIAQSFAPSAMQKSLQFKVQIDEELPKKLIGDRIRTEQILMALLSNAFKFTSHGEIRLEIRFLKSIHTLSSDISNIEHYPTCWIIVEFIIFDTGPGIPPDKQEAAFERFGRLHASYKESEYSGKGFGLSLVKRRVDEMKGELQLKSIEGKGTTFKLLIPYKLSLETI